MTREEAILIAVSGVKIRLTHWRVGRFIEYRKGQFLDEDGFIIKADFNGGDWEIYEEPKPMAREETYARLKELLEKVASIINEFEDSNNNEIVVGVRITISEKAFEFNGERFILIS